MKFPNGKRIVEESNQKKNPGILYRESIELYSGIPGLVGSGIVGIGRIFRMEVPGVGVLNREAG
eukprot:2054585-Pyramimonas_sp.AAC.1